MSKSIIFLVLALCLLVQSYVISKEVEPVSCFDKKSAEIQETADVQVSVNI